jgi:BON domain
MVEPLFGSVSQLWPAMPAPAFGYVQTPMASAHHRFGTMSTGLSAQGPAPGGPLSAVPTSNPMPIDPYAFAGGVMPIFAGPSVGAGLSAVASSPLPTGVPALTASEIAVGVTAPWLLTAVAMRRGQPLGPNNDQEIEDFISDAFDLLPGTNDVEVRVEGGRATLTGSVPHKRLKRDVGEIAWTIPTVNDVQNNVTITQRRRSRTSREGESPAVAARKQT